MPEFKSFFIPILPLVLGGNAMFSVKCSERGIQLFCCACCSYSTPYKGNLKVHLLTHRDVRPFVCNVCHKSFNQKAHLVTHFRLHSGERPFKCDLCGKAFAQDAALSYHKRTHIKY
ncbi:unnamed protein product [Larinioides sclopetarius]|uniref:C2H2-type domain-containing protein n=1 Tax=Larinioides sclopetarius TaxID=280406 RepID=A0AAV2BY26_9ARAC